ncbi:hypothetical protein L0337_05440 [candidate division KSB1 bacterium]|nr:hypothetical protein [candidate division KSB1 bacterium]
MKTESPIYCRSCFKSPRLFVCILSWLLAIAFVEFNPAYGQSLQISQFTINNSQILRVSDFNITGSGSVSELFILKIINTGAPTEVILRLEFRSSRYPDPIVEASTRPFTMATSPIPRTLTYQDFRGRGANPDVTIDNFSYNSESVEDITDAVLKTGRLPSGTYFFNITLINTQNPGASPPPEQREFEISNPTTLDLISPGAPVGGSECFAQFGLLPQFKWDSNADRFLITVCEVLSTNSSPEDVMQNEPRLQRLVQRGSDFFGSPSFIYPPGGLPLEYGKTYYWQVQAMIDAPSGEVRLPSEIWCFQISAIGDPGTEIMLQQLLSLLNSGEFEALFNEGGPLHGFRLTGAAALNGRRLNLAELISFLRSRPVRVVSTQVEP